MPSDGVCPFIAAVSAPAQEPGMDQLLQDPAAQRGFNIEQADGLRKGQRQSCHLAKLALDSGAKLFARFEAPSLCGLHLLRVLGPGIESSRTARAIDLRVVPTQGEHMRLNTDERDLLRRVITAAQLMAQAGKAQLMEDLRLLVRLERGEPISPDELRSTRLVAEDTLAILTKHSQDIARMGQVLADLRM